MPIKSLELYLFERKLASSIPIEILSNATIGIDVEHYLSRIYTYKKEQFLAGIGGIPASLHDYIKSDLDVFAEFNIKPVFVISGLNIQLRMPNYRAGQLSLQELHVETTWSKMGNKQHYSFNNIEPFRLYTEPLPLRPMINDLVALFVSLGIDYLIAPYDASFQLSYMFQVGMIDTIYGSTDLLLTKIDKFILGMEFQSKDFRFVSKPKVLNELGLSDRQFSDLCLMVGCSVQPEPFPIFPPMPKQMPMLQFPHLTHFKLGLDMVYQYFHHTGDNSGSLYRYIASLNDPTMMELYCKGFCAMHYLPILNKDGQIEYYDNAMVKLGHEPCPELQLAPQEAERHEGAGHAHTSALGPDSAGSLLIKAPNDLHTIISQRLPAELYFYQSIGLSSIELLEGIALGQIRVRPGMEGGLSDTYKALITLRFFLKNLDFQCNLLTQLFARYYQVKRIAVKYWFSNEDVEVNTRLLPPIGKRVEPLYYHSVNASLIFSLEKFLTGLHDSGEGQYTRQSEITQVEDIVSTIMLRALYLLGVIDESSKDIAPLGRILKRFVSEAESALTNQDLEHVVVLLLLLQTKTIGFGIPSTKFSNVPKFFKEDGSSTQNHVDLTEQESKSITLLSRVMSLKKFNIAPINYLGPISRNLLSFRSHVKVVASTVSHTVQCLLIDFIVHQENNALKTQLKSRNDWGQLVGQLPFFKDINNTLLGVVAEIYFEYAVRKTKTGSSRADALLQTKDHLLNHVFQVKNSPFNSNVFGNNSVSEQVFDTDLAAGVKFWKQFHRLARLVHDEDELILSELELNDIECADTLLNEHV